MRHLSLLRRDHDNKCDRRQVNLKSASWTFETYGTFAPGTAKTIFFALQTSKTDNNALDIDVIYNLNLTYHLIQQTTLLPNAMQNFQGHFRLAVNMLQLQFTL
jgi:hypothetical protein